MSGTDQSSMITSATTDGIIPRALTYLLERVRTMETKNGCHTKYGIRASYVELYNEVSEWSRKTMSHTKKPMTTVESHTHT